jgi:hypothetical protein
MKFLNWLSLFTLVLLFTIAFSACDEPSSNSDSCQKLPQNPVFTRSMTNLSLIDHVTPLGEIQAGHPFSDHSYVTNKPHENVPVFAPTTLEVYNVVFNGVDYTIQARANCAIFIEFAHITSPITELLELAGDAHLGLDASAPTLAKFEAGTLLATTTGTSQSGTWDFAVYNKDRSASFLNTARLGQVDKYRYADCPYDYFESSLKTRLYDLLGPKPAILPKTCRAIERGIAGTLAGTWWENVNDRADQIQNPSLSPLVIGSSLDGKVRVFIGEGPLDIVADQLPELVWTSHCYNVPAGHIALRLVTTDTLEVSTGSETCENLAFPLAAPKIYYR